MKKLFRSAFLFLSFLTFFAIVSPAQTETNKPILIAQSTAYVDNNKTSIENRPRVIAEAPKNAGFEIERKILEIINARRAEKGLEPLQWSDEVAKIARLHSENMAKYKFFDHYGQDGLRVDGRADSIGLSEWRAISENIAYNRGFENPIESACESWMQSPSHRENLLKSRWKETGIGVSIAADGTYYFTQVFLAR